jgi:glycerol-3-phosphate dehydrogenase
MNAPPEPLPRAALLDRLCAHGRFDLLVIGGGATGLGLALEAAQRGLRVALLEAADFAAGTSSRSTKLLHGGVRYLAQGRIGLVREALHERSTLLAQAPHLAQPLGFVVPTYRHRDTALYGLGLAAYDRLAGRRSLGRTERLGAEAVARLLPGVQREGLHGGVRYWDAQFDDARLAVALARSAWRHGAALLNHCSVTALAHDDHDRLTGVVARDHASGATLHLAAGCVVNATGVWVDRLRALDRGPTAPMVRPSQGVHLVVDAGHLGGEHALLVPRTADGRVLFAVPWLGKVLLGTTDTPCDGLAAEPRPFEHEVDFILREAARCLQRPPTRADVRSAWAGLRPLVQPAHGEPHSTRAISREHTVRIAPSKLVTVTGGKWTTERVMAHDVLEACAEAGLLPRRAHAWAAPLVGAAVPGAPVPLSRPPGEHLYGDEAAALHALPGADRWLCPGLSEAMVRFAVRHEMALGVADVLARRSRLLFLDAAAAGRVAGEVAALVAAESGRPLDAPALAGFKALAARYARLGDPVSTGD